MSTTNLFIELLIGGIQASIWIALLLFSFVGYEWISVNLPRLENWALLITVLALAFWYTLGIVVDRLSHALFMLYDPAEGVKRIKWVNRKAQAFLLDTREEIMLVQQGRVVEMFEYTRTRVRIMRSTVFNLILITISGIVFINSRCYQLGCAPIQSRLILLTVVAGLLLILAALVAYILLEVAYDYWLSKVEASIRLSE